MSRQTLQPKLFVAGTLALAISMAPFQSRALTGANEVAKKVTDGAEQVKTSAATTLAKVQSSEDVQMAKVMNEWLATSAVIVQMQAARGYSSSIASIQDADVRTAVGAGATVLIMTGVAAQAWNTLARIGQVPAMMKATPGFGSKVTAVGGAAFRVAALGVVIYTVYRTGVILFLDKQDFDEIMMRLEANRAHLELQLSTQAKLMLNATAGSPAPTATTPANNADLFKLE